MKKGNLQYASEKLSIVAEKVDKFFIEPIEAINRGEEFRKNWKVVGDWE